MAQSPQLNDSQLNLLAKIAANTGETQPKHGDGQHNLLFKIAQNTYASAVNSASDVSSVAGKTGAVTLVPTDIVGLQSALDGKLGESDTSYVIAQAGDNLATKYGQAKVLTPNGNARSATNRASLIVFPGVYSLSAELAIDTEFVDIIGLGAQFQSPAVIVTNNTLNVSANDVRVSGISVGAQEFKIASNKPLQVFENCKGGNNSFAGNGGTASGEFVGCVGGDDSFGGYDIEQSSTASFLDCVAGNEGFGGNVGDYPSAKYISCRLTSGSFPTIYIPGRARFCLDEDYNIVNADGGYDTDADSYFTTAGVTDDTAKEQLNLFVIGIKRLGLWNDMVCWPLRSTQNAGTGSTAYSLGGLGAYNGTLVNGPTWGVNGINRATGSNQYIQLPSFDVASAGQFSIYSASKIDDFSNGAQIQLLGFRSSGGDLTISSAQLNVYCDSTLNNLRIASGGMTGGDNLRARDISGGPTSIVDAGFFTFFGSIGPSANFTRLLALNNSFSGSDVGSGTAMANGTDANGFILGAQGATTGWDATSAFAAWFDIALNQSQLSSVNSLYKSTLGQGLGLP